MHSIGLHLLAIQPCRPGRQGRYRAFDWRGGPGRRALSYKSLALCSKAGIQGWAPAPLLVSMLVRPDTNVPDRADRA